MFVESIIQHIDHAIVGVQFQRIRIRIIIVRMRIASIGFAVVVVVVVADTAINTAVNTAVPDAVDKANATPDAVDKCVDKRAADSVASVDNAVPVPRVRLISKPKMTMKTRRRILCKECNKCIKYSSAGRVRVHSKT